MMHETNNNIALLLKVTPGLLGLFDLGYLYLGARSRAAAEFLAITVVLCVVIILDLLFPQLLPVLIMVPVLPTVWFLGYLVDLYGTGETAKQRSCKEVAHDR
jgi:hypothetical protein